MYSVELIQSMPPGFTASRSWALSFMKRHDLSLHAKTLLSQHLPCDLEEKLSSFHQLVKTKRKDAFDDNLIINMDKTPVYFDLQPGKIINKSGEKSVLIRTMYRK